MDNQLPVALAQWLAEQGADAVHVLNLGLDALADTGIWAQAAAENRIVVSKDEDFFHLANRDGEMSRWAACSGCESATAGMPRCSPVLPRTGRPSSRHSPAGSASWRCVEQSSPALQRVMACECAARAQLTGDLATEAA